MKWDRIWCRSIWQQASYELLIQHLHTWLEKFWNNNFANLFCNIKYQNETLLFFFLLVWEETKQKNKYLGMWTWCFFVLDTGCFNALPSLCHSMTSNNLTCLRYSDSFIVFGILLNLNHISYTWLKADKEVCFHSTNKHMLLRVSQNTYSPIYFPKLCFLLSGSSHSQAC